MKNLYIRTAIFMALKSVVYILVLLLTGWFVGSAMSTMAYAIIFACVYAIMTFIVSEIIYVGNRLKLPVLAGQVLMGYVIDTMVSIGFFSWYYDRNMFLEQTVFTHVLYGSIFIVSTVSAYVLKKRMAAMRGGVEGLM